MLQSLFKVCKKRSRNIPTSTTLRVAVSHIPKTKMAMSTDGSSSWFYNHPEYQRLLEKSKDDPKQNPTILHTFLVYLDLCEGKKWWDVNLHFWENDSRLYLTGRPNKHDSVHVVMPVSHSEQLTCVDMQRLTRLLQELESTNESGLTLALGSSSSQIIYYKVFDGIVPLPPDDIEKQAKSEKRYNDNKEKRRLMYNFCKPDTSTDT